MHMIIKSSKDQVIVALHKRRGIVSSTHNIFNYANHLLSVPLNIDCIATSNNFRSIHILCASRIVILHASTAPVWIGNTSTKPNWLIIVTPALEYYL